MGNFGSLIGRMIRSDSCFMKITLVATWRKDLGLKNGSRETSWKATLGSRPDVVVAWVRI